MHNTAEALGNSSYLYNVFEKHVLVVDWHVLRVQKLQNVLHRCHALGGVDQAIKLQGQRNRSVQEERDNVLVRLPVYLPKVI